MEHMVYPPVFPGALQGNHIPGLRHHTDGAPVPAFVRADGTQGKVRQILAAGAGVDTALGFQNGVRKALGLLHGHFQHMKGKPLGGLAADAG